MHDDFIKHLLTQHQACKACPTNDEVARFFEFFLGLLFPNFADKPITSAHNLIQGFEFLRKEFLVLISELPPDQRTLIADEFFSYIPQYYELIRKDIQAMYDGDPAATSVEEVVRTYPGFYAIAAYRLAHKLLKWNVPYIPRVITEYAHSRTGIDIHPGATIGHSFCIDHGTGVVIGQTTIIGNFVKIYQGVTLGALSVVKKDIGKRHPTIEDHVIIYAGATILGGNTVIGESSVIGGNVWLTKSVKPHSKIYYKVGQNLHTTQNDKIKS